MPQITNTFLKSKMNKDLDSRILPNGEYRDARNLQISRSQGSEVGEFENILGNTQLKNLYTGEGGKFIGQFTNDTTADIYLYNTSYDKEGVCPRDTVVYFNSFGAVVDNEIGIFHRSGDNLRTRVNNVAYDTALGVVTLNVWNHVLLRRVGGDLDIFTNGTKTVLSTTQTTTLDFNT